MHQNMSFKASRPLVPWRGYWMLLFYDTQIKHYFKQYSSVSKAAEYISKGKQKHTQSPMFRGWTEKIEEVYIVCLFACIVIIKHKVPLGR